MSAVEVLASNYTRAGFTCKPAMGFSFAAGTTDGGAAAHNRQLGCCAYSNLSCLFFKFRNLNGSRPFSTVEPELLWCQVHDIAN